MRHIKKSIITALALTAMLTTVGVESRSCMSVKAEGISYTATEATRYAAPASYYSSVDTSSGEKLIKSLTSIISNGHKAQGYDALFRCYKTSDVKPGTNEIWDMYSNCKFDVDKDHGASYKKEGDIYNREHTVPQSWFNKANPMVCDAHHIFPTDGKVNGIRSSFLHGEVKPGTATYTSTNGCQLGSSASSLYSGKVFEVPDEYKGDFARTYFYMATRYSSQVGSWGGEANKVFKGSFPYLSNYSIDMYTKWDAMDPVSEKEISRNEAVYKFQGNRNPFIDHPEYVAMIWPSDYNQNVTVDQTKVDAVIAKINALPQASAITLNDKTVINEANAAYIALNFKEKAAVTNYPTLQAALNKIAELEAPAPVDPTETIGVTEALNIAKSLTAGKQTDKEYTITGKISGNIEPYNSQYGNATFDITDGASTITVFRAKEGASKASFTATSFAEKIVVGNTVVVVGNIKNFVQNNSSLYEVNPCYVLSSTKEDPTPVNQENVDAVIDLIDELPLLENLVLEDESDINAIVELYNELSSAEKALVTNYADLTAAIAKINELKGSTPGPDPDPIPTEEIKIEFKGLNTAYTKNYSFKIGEYSFLTNVAFANDDYGNFIRIGGNSSNSTDIPSKFGISGKGGSIEMQFDAANSSGVTFNVGGQMTGDGISKWTILASTNGGTSWDKVSSGTSVSSALKGTLSETAKSVRYALVIEGNKNPRLDLTSMEILAAAKPVEPTVRLSTVKTNKALSVSYDKYETISNVTAKTVVLSHISKLEYNLDSVEYGVIYAEKSKVNNEYSLIKESYSKDNTDYHYVKATITASDNEFVVKALLDLDINTEYVAVVVCIQNDNIVFANQATVKVVDMINYYLTNNLITDAEQASVLGSLIS